MITQKYKNASKVNLRIKDKVLIYFFTHKKLIITETIGLIFCLAMSFIFHFAYEWFGKSHGIAFLFATNESVWEHSKIIFYPYFIFSLVEFFVIKPHLRTYLIAKCVPLVLCIPAMLVLFYTYSGIIGENFTAVDILISIAIIIAMFAISYKILSDNTAIKHWMIWAIFTLIILILLIIFTYYPPHINLFFDKTKGIYGLQ